MTCSGLIFQGSKVISLVAPKPSEPSKKDVETVNSDIVDKKEITCSVQIKNAVFYLFNDVDKFKRKVRRKFEKAS